MFRWGVIGPGRIAAKFAGDIAALDDAVITAVASRSAERARGFAERFLIERSYGSHAELLADRRVDAVYVATPHTAHRAATLAALEAGKPVLCEKPLAPNLAQVEELVAAARRCKVFLMEAMWTRFLPVMLRIREWLDAGRIGEVRLVRASFGFRCGWDQEHRLLDPALAGGALLDVGVYPIALALWAFGAAPRRVEALADLGRTGVDEQVGVLLGFPGGGLTVLDAAIRTQTQHAAWICGTEGRIGIAPPFWSSTGAELWKDMRVEERADCPLRAHGFEYEAEEVARRVAAGAIESPGMPHADSIELARTCDRVREAVGLRYPFEEEVAT